MRLFLLLSTLFFGTVASFAASVTATCHPPGPTMAATEQAQCSVQSPAEGLLVVGSASASLGLDLATDPAAFSVLRTAQGASVQVTYNPSFPTGLSVGGAANTRINFDEFLRTAGSVRPGYAILQSFGSDFVSSENGNGGVDFYFQGNPNTHIACIAEDQACSPSDQTLAMFLPLIPISLGTPLELMAHGELGAAGANVIGETSGRASVTAWYEFRFVEADGVTPVAVTLTPEPSTASLLGFVLCGVTLLGLGAWARRRLSYR